MAILPSHKLAAAMAIKRMGESVLITEPVDSGTTDGYGKSDESWTVAGSEYAVRIYTDGAEPGQYRTEGGRYRTDSPRLLFRLDSAIREGFRATISGQIYEINAITEYPTHLEAQTVVVG